MRLNKFPSKIKAQRQVKSQHCTFSPKSMTSQEYQNHYPKSIKNPSKSSKIHQNLLKNIENHQKTQSQRENDLRPKFVPTTLAVLGILSSCPRVMTMQCWKSQIPPPLSTRLRIIIGWFFGFVLTKKKGITT